MSVLSSSLRFLKHFFPEILSWIGLTTIISFIYLTLIPKDDIFSLVLIAALHLCLLTSMMLHLGSLVQKQPISYLHSLGLAFKKASDAILVFATFFLTTVIMIAITLFLSSALIPKDMLWLKWGVNSSIGGVFIIIFLMLNAILIQVVVFHGGGYQNSLRYCIRFLKEKWASLLGQLLLIGSILTVILSLDALLLYQLFPTALTHGIKVFFETPNLSLISLVLLKFTLLPLLYPFLLFLYIKLRPTMPSE